MIDLDHVIEAVTGTAAEVYEPHSALGLIGLLIISLPAIIGAVLAGIALWRQRDTNKKVDAVNRSVNCRPTTMRKDFDMMRAEMQRGFRQVSLDIGGLREELRTERIERIEGDRRR